MTRGATGTTGTRRMPGGAPTRAEVQAMAEAHRDAMAEADDYLAEVDAALGPSPEGPTGPGDAAA